MNIVKKLFPGYETKKELKHRLEQQLELEKWRNSYHGIMLRLEMDISKVVATAEIEETAPEEALKKQVRSKLMDLLEPAIEYEAIEPYGRYNRRMAGTLYVGIKR